MSEERKPLWSDDDIDRLLSLTDMPHVPYPPTHTEEVVILSKADYDALVANQAAPPAMTEEVRETIEDALTHCRPELSNHPLLLKQRDKVDAALTWLEAMKEAANVE